MTGGSVRLFGGSDKRENASVTRRGTNGDAAALGSYG
jgi:hypothetical protein